MPYVPDADSATPEDRLRFIARILVKGLLRLQSRRQIPDTNSADSAAIPPSALEAVLRKLLTVTVR